MHWLTEISLLSDKGCYCNSHSELFSGDCLSWSDRVRQIISRKEKGKYHPPTPWKAHKKGPLPWPLNQGGAHARLCLYNYWAGNTPVSLCPDGMFSPSLLYRRQRCTEIPNVARQSLLSPGNLTEWSLRSSENLMAVWSWVRWTSKTLHEETCQSLLLVLTLESPASELMLPDVPTVSEKCRHEYSFHAKPKSKRIIPFLSFQTLDL